MKDELRKNITARKRSFSADQMTLASHQITERVLSLDSWKNAHSISIYTSLSSEVSTAELVGVAQLTHKTVVSPESKTRADIYIVPGLAFDRKGNRLGRGRGFYDRLLAGVNAIKIGLAFEIQMVDNVPYTLYDVPMDMVITERNIYEK